MVIVIGRATWSAALESDDAHGTPHDGVGTPRVPSRIAELCRRHAVWATDLTGGATIPPGWSGVLDSLFSSLAIAVSGRAPLCLAFHAVAEARGRLLVDVRPSSGASEGDPRMEVVERAVAEVGRASACTCRFCGGPGRGRILCREWALCDDHHDDHLEPPETDGTGDASFALYEIDQVIAAAGAVPAISWDHSAPSDETTHQARLRAILEAGERGRWRSLARPGEAVFQALDDLDLKAPHMGEVTGLVRTHSRAALAIGQPTSIPPLLLLGEPGLGKTWYLARLARALGVPFRHYPMNLSSLGEGLFGAHAHWRNGKPGLVARTLLAEAVANPMIVVDEVDKPPLIGGEDPYRAFYATLEPEGAASFVDEYLSFPMDASAVLWILAANSTDPLPAPMLDRLTVIRLPAMDEAQLRAVAASVYDEANKARGHFFDRGLVEGVVRRLLAGNVRGIKRAIVDAMVRAAADGRRSVLPDDVRPPEAATRRPIGFVHGGRP